MSLNATQIYPGAVLVWQVNIDAAQQGTSIWNSSLLVSGAIGVGGTPRPGAPLTVQLYVDHDGATNVTVQRGLGRVAAAAAVTQAATFPIPGGLGPVSFPSGTGTAQPIMVGEPLVLRTDALAPATVSVSVLAIVVDTVDYPEG